MGCRSMRYILPKGQLIGLTGKMPDMVWISEPSRADQKSDPPRLQVAALVGELNALIFTGYLEFSAAW